VKIRKISTPPFWWKECLSDVLPSQQSLTTGNHAKSESCSWKRANRASAASAAKSRSWTKIGRFNRAGRGIPGDF